MKVNRVLALLLVLTLALGMMGLATADDAA